MRLAPTDRQRGISRENPASDQQNHSERLSVVRRKRYHTPAGTVFLQSCCPASLVRDLQADEGLHAFARLPEREHQLLLSIAQQPENRLTLAYTTTGKIVGQVTLVPVDDWWQDLANAYEIGLEVSINWRKLGLAHQLLSLALEFEGLEEYLILGMGLFWHWDYQRLALSRFGYRAMLAHLVAAHGFVEYPTSEPNIRMDPANILLARLGSHLDKENLNNFFQRLLFSETLPGL